MTTAADYWQRHYADEFHYGHGTEDILAGLMTIPPVSTWVDVGSGSESLLWSIALRARRLIAVDIDAERLTILRQFADAGQPRPAYVTALALCGRTDPTAFQDRCAALQALVQADCLAGALPADPFLTDGSADLVTQFGLLGLTSCPEEFIVSFVGIHRLLAPAGWAAGANWVADRVPGRVELTEGLYRRAADHAGIDLLLLNRIDTTDPEFPVVWTYVGRTTPCPQALPLDQLHPTR